MKISCPSCEAKYSIGDEKVQNRRAKIHCRKCGANIVIDGRLDPPSVTIGDAAGSPETMTNAAAATASTHQYTIDFGENDQRTLSVGEIVQAYNAGQVTGETYLWADGMADWTPLAQVEEIVLALNAGSSPVASPTPRATGSIPTHTTSASTARTAGRSAAADLFGGIAHAGSEEDVTTSAPNEPVAPTVSTGARNESSVLFSLSALTASAKSTPSIAAPAASSTSRRDDSGLIDLKALASQAQAAPAASEAGSAAVGSPTALGGMAMPLGLGAPLGGGLGAPLGGGASPFGSSIGSPDVAYPRQKSRTGLYVGGGIAVAMIALAIAIATRPAPVEAPKPEPAPIQTTTRAAVDEPEKPKDETPSTATPPPTGTGAASAAPSTPKAAPRKWSGKRSTTGTSGKTGSSQSSGGGDSPTPKPKPASKCGCSPSDLPCNMRCAARGG